MTTTTKPATGGLNLVEEAKRRAAAHYRSRRFMRQHVVKRIAKRIPDLARFERAVRQYDRLTNRWYLFGAWEHTVGEVRKSIWQETV